VLKIHVFCQSGLHFIHIES